MPTFQEIIVLLTKFWEKQGCIVHFGYDVEKGAGTFNPATFLRSLGPEPYSAAFVEPSRRPSDGRYGENPNRLQLFHQFQVLIKPSPLNILDLYKKSLEAIGIDLKKHDLRFVHDDWESPTLGAYGLGWEVWIDGMEVTQFTYFQGLANIPMETIAVEITYGLERLCMHAQNKDDFFSMQWNEEFTYGEICKQQEVEWSAYNFTYASASMWKRHFDDYEKETKELIARNLPLPAYDFVLKASHAFNLLDARGVISVTERAGYIARIRDLTRLIAKEYLAQREELGYPLKARNPDPPHIPKPKAPLKSFDPYRRDTFLLEIGSEELPATFVPIGMENLRRDFEALLNELNLNFESIEMIGTPRRLGLLVHGLVEGSSDEHIKRKGPKATVAFDESGTLSKPGMGFTKSLGLETFTRQDVEAGKIKQIAIEGDYLFATIVKEGQSVYSLLSEALPSLITSIDFPKKMRWSTLNCTYARPLHWITALYGDHVVPFVVGNIASGNHTFGHSQLKDEKITLSDASTYPSMLKAGFVEPNVDQRKVAILTQLKEIEKEYDAQAVDAATVLDQVLYLSEWPQLTTATFSKDYLKLPKEVLISEMIEHQKYFPLENKNKELLDTFVIVADNTPNSTIRHGNQKVLSARLADGAFLFQEDMSHPLSFFHEKLGHITFQKDLGSMLDKVERLTGMAQKLNEQLGFADPKQVERGAYLCKTDLASEMVKEFPHLQGTIGKAYALLQKEDPEVAESIEEHWMPRAEGASLPKTPTGVILALADKLDNLISYFKVGLKPTSSSDPYGLRRQAIGLVRILLDQKISVDLSRFVLPEVLSFITSRAKVVFEDEGFSKDEIEASLLGDCMNPFDQLCKLQALRTFRTHPAFPGLLEVYKRAKGQLSKGKAGSFDLSLAKEKAEMGLYEALKKVGQNWESLIATKDYAKAFEAIASLQSPMAHLFDQVKILADDQKVQTNRLSLLDEVLSPIEEILDLSKLQR